MMPDYSIKGKLEKIIMSNSKPTKIIRDKIEKIISTKKEIKKDRFKKNEYQFWHKKIKSNYEGWNWKAILIKKRIRKNQNKKK